MEDISKFVLRISSVLHAKLKKLAEKNSNSLNQVCSDILTSHFQLLKEKQSNPLVDVHLNLYQGDLLGVILFGSYARGDYTDESDLDFLLVLRENVKISRALYTEWDLKVRPLLEDSFAMELSPHFSHLPNSNYGSLWLEIAIDGKILWEREDILTQKLIAIRNAVACGNYMKKSLSGANYWIKNEKF